MGKRLIPSKPLVKRGTKRTTQKAFKAKRHAGVRTHYTKPVRVKAALNAVRPDKDYYFQQIYSPNDVENPLKGIWDRANHLRSVGYDFGKPVLVKMSPQEFIDLNPEPNKLATEYKVPTIKRALESGEWEVRSMISEGPFMDIGSDGRVITHEGRNRATVLRDLGYAEMPVLLYIRLERDHDWRTQEPWMKPEVNRLSKQMFRERERQRALRKKEAI